MLQMRTDTTVRWDSW